MAGQADNKRIVKNTILLYFRSFAIMAISLYTSRIVLQALGVEDYGLYGAIGSIVSMFAIIDGVLSVGTSRFLTFELGRGDKEKLKQTFNAAFLMHCTLAVILLILLETIGVWFLNNKMVIPEGREMAANVILQLSILVSMLSLTQVPFSAVIIAHERMDIYAWVGIAEVLFKLGLVFVLLYVPFGDNLIAYGSILAAWTIGLQIFYRIFCYRLFPETHLSLCRDKSIYKSMLNYSMWDFIGQFCFTGNNHGANILINMFFGVTVNAARSVAYQVENALTQFTNNFMTSITPQIVKSYAQQDYNRFFQLIYAGGKFAFFLLFTMSLPLFLEMDYVLSLWLVEVPEYATMFLRFIMCNTLFRISSHATMNGVHATGDVKFLNLSAGLWNMLTYLPVIYILFKCDLPVWSMFFVMGQSSLVANIFDAWALHRKLKYSVSDYLKEVYLKPYLVCALSCVVPLIVFSQMESSFLRLVVTILVCVTSSLCCIYFLGLNQQMKQQVKETIDQKILSKFKK